MDKIKALYYTLFWKCWDSNQWSHTLYVTDVVYQNNVCGLRSTCYCDKSDEVNYRIILTCKL